MSDKPSEFRQKLFQMQETTPALRDAYQQEIEAMLNPDLTFRKALPRVILLLVMLLCLAGIVWATLFYRPGPLILCGWVALAIGLAGASAVIIRDLWRRKHSTVSQLSIARILTVAAGILTVVALLKGMSAPSDPKAIFGAFYVFVFYFACVAWVLEARIAAAELASREQMLRIECRLADLAERLQSQ